MGIGKDLRALRQRFQASTKNILDRACRREARRLFDVEGLERRQLFTGGGLTAVYYANPDLTGSTVARADANVNFDASSAAWQPAAFSPSGYSVRWSGTVTATQTGVYTFQTTVNDGVNLWVNGQWLVGQWFEAGDVNADGLVNGDDVDAFNAALQATDFEDFIGNYYPDGNYYAADMNGDDLVDQLDVPLFDAKQIDPALPSQHSWSISLQAGTAYPVVMEYYNQSGIGADADTAVAQLSWKRPSDATFSPVPGASLDVGGGLAATYYATPDLSGSPTVTRVDPNIDFNWRTGSPDPALPADNFSARWTGILRPTVTGVYRLTVKGDAGMRLWVNGVLRADAWAPLPTPTFGEGDLNADGVVDDLDLQAVWDHFGNKSAPVTGDTNKDYKVDVADLNNVMNNFGATGSPVAGDTNADGVVDNTDLNNVLNNFGSVAPPLPGDVNNSHEVDLTDVNIVMGNLGEPGQMRESTISLTAGVEYTIVMEAYDLTGMATAQLQWGRLGAGGFGTVPVPQSVLLPPKPTATVAAELAGYEGVPVPLSATFSDIGGFTASVDWGDPDAPGLDPEVAVQYLTGQSGTLAASHAYVDDGSYSARLILTGRGGTTIIPFVVNVGNVAPTATLVNSGPVEIGASVSVSFTGQSDVSSADTRAGFLYSYDFNNDGTFEIVDTKSPIAIVPSQYLTPGPLTRIVRGRIKDQDGGCSYATTTITVRGIAVSGNSTVSEGEPYSLFLNYLGLTITHWHVDWGDDSDPDGDGRVGQDFGAGVSVPTHLYPDGPASYTIRVTADTNLGLRIAAPLTVQVFNAPPTLNVDGATTVEITSDYVLHLSAEDFGRDGVLYWTVTWGDGTGQSFPGASVTATHRFPTVGTYPVRVVAHDKDGAWTAPDHNVAVTTAIPTSPAAVSAHPSYFDSVLVGWTDRSNNELGFTISRALAYGGSPISDFTVVGQVGPNVTAFLDLTAYSGYDFIYKVTAFNGTGPSAQATSSMISVPFDEWAVTMAPRLLAVGSYWELVDPGAHLWQYNAAYCVLLPRVDGVGISVQAIGGIYDSVIDDIEVGFRSRYVPFPVPNLDDESKYCFLYSHVDQLQEGTVDLAGQQFPPALTAQDELDYLYSIRLEAATTLPRGLHSSYATLSMPFVGSEPFAEELVDVYSTVSNGEVEFNWRTVPDERNEYGEAKPHNVLEISTDGVHYRTIMDVDGEGEIHSAELNINVVPVGEFYLRVASKGFNDAKYSAPVHIVPTNVPTAPSNLVTSVEPGTIHLYWADKSIDEDHFRVYRRPSGTGTFSLLATLDANVTHYADTDVVPGASYVYRVVTVRGGIESDPTADASARALTLITFDHLPTPTYNWSPSVPAAPLPATAWNVGDVFVAVGRDIIYELTPTGTLVRTLDFRNPQDTWPWWATRWENSSMAFQADGSLIALSYTLGHVFKFAADGSPVGYLDEIIPTPESVLVDASGYIYVGSPFGNGFFNNIPQDGLYKYAPDGTVLAHYIPNVPVDHFDLAADQHTVYFTSEGAGVHVLDLNTGKTSVFDQISLPTLSDVISDALFAANGLRFVPDDIISGGGILVADGGPGDDNRDPNDEYGEYEYPAGISPGIKLFDLDGNLVRTYGENLGEWWFAINLDPDGKTFWSAGYNSGRIYRFDLLTGQLVYSFESGGPVEGGSIAGLTVYGERTAAIPVQQRYTSFVHAVSDPGATLTYELVGDAHGATMTKAGQITWAPPAPGTYHFTVRASNSLGDHAITGFNITVAPDLTPNRSPAIQTTALSEGRVGMAYQNRIVATDADGDPLTYSLIDSPGFSIDPVTGVLRWSQKPADLTAGSRLVTVRVTDPAGSFSERQFAVSFLPSAAQVPHVASVSGSAHTTTIDLAISPNNSLPIPKVYHLYRGDTSDFAQMVLIANIYNPWSSATSGDSLLDPVYYTDRNLDPLHTYYYAVVAESDSGVSIPSQIIGVTTHRPAPSNLLAEVVDGEAVVLTWNEPFADNVKYQIYRGETPNVMPTEEFALDVVWSGTDQFYVDDSVEPGHTYYYLVTAIDWMLETESDPSNLGSATFSDSLPATPGNVVEHRALDGFYLTWNAVTAGDLAGYNVYRGPTKLNSSPLQQLWFVDPLSPDASAVTYYVAAVDTAGQESLRATVSAPSPDLARPSVAAAPISTSQIEVSWADVPGATGYIVMRTDPRTGAVDTFSVAYGPFYDQGLPFNATYDYTVRAFNDDGDVSLLSDRVNATTWDVPAKLTGLSATAESGTRVHLVWVSPADERVQGYDVLRSSVSAAGPYELIRTFAGDAEYYDQSCDPNTTYWYEVVAVNGTLHRSEPSAPAVVQTLAGATPPPAPSNLQAGYAGAGRVGLKWNAPAGLGLLGYDVYRSKDPNFIPSPATLIGSSDSPRYTDDGLDLANANVYYYRVIAVGDDLDGHDIFSLPSNTARVDTTVLPTSPPAVPTGVRATDVQGDHVTLSWIDNSLDETEFDVYRREAGTTPWVLAGRVTADVTTFTDATVLASTAYEYVVAAHNVAGDANSAVVPVSTPDVGPAPDAPTGLHVDAAATSYDRIALVWNVVSSGPAVSGYYVYRRTPAGSYARVSPKLTADAGAATVSYVDAGLDAGASYEYYVTAVTDRNRSSVPSNTPPLLASTPNAPVNAVPVASIRSPLAKVQYSWEDSPSPARIERQTDVTGIVDDPNGATDIASWTLSLVPVAVAGAGSTFHEITIAAGIGAVGSSKADTPSRLGTIDPSRFPAGAYRLRLTVVDNEGHVAQDDVGVQLSSSVRLGNLTLPSTDLTVDLPGAGTVSLTRTYDSQQADVEGNIGYGWTLSTSGTQVRTTARSDSSQSSQPVAYRAGDLVYITLPDGQQNTFQFWPVPNNYSAGGSQDAYSRNSPYSHYYVMFVAVDGSGSQLHVAGDISDPGSKIDLIRNAESGAFYSYTDGAYNPASAGYGGKFLLTTADGTTYTVNASSGRLESVEDANENLTNYSPTSVSDDAGTGLSIKIGVPVVAGQLKTITAQLWNNTAGLPVGAPVVYQVDMVSGNLIAVTDRAGNTTHYFYENPAFPHHLTRIRDARGLDVLKADYNGDGTLKALQDVRGQAAPITDGGTDGTRATQTVSDPSGNTVEVIYDAQGSKVREITAVRSGGTVIKYSVRVWNYQYYGSARTFASDLSDMLARGKDDNVALSLQNLLTSVSEYAPFEVPGNDPTGLRYSLPPTLLTRESTYHVPSGPGDIADAGMLISDRVLGADGVMRTTSYGSYVRGKPGVITDPYGKVTRNEYDAAGNLLSTTNALNETTYFSYTTGGSYLYNGTTTPVDYAGLPKGLPLETWRIVPGGGVVVLSSNVYYAAGSSSQDYGRLASTTDAAGATIHYGYDEEGRAYLTWRLGTLPGSVVVRIEDQTYYDAAGREKASVNGRVVKAADRSVVYDAGTTTKTFYDASGLTLVTVDPFGGRTVTTYDARGNVVRTLAADGTEARAVYDDLGRVVWASDGFASTSTYTFTESTGVLTWTHNDAESTYVVTHTLYDSLGRVTGTERYRQSSIALNADPTGVAGLFVTVAPSAVVGNRLSTTATVYDGTGRTVETVSATSLRTGTVYYPNGQVHYTGSLKSDAPGLWYQEENPATRLSYFMTQDGRPMVTTYEYNKIDDGPDGTVSYDQMIDANGLATRSYKDVLGRVVRVDVFNTAAPGHVIGTQTLYGVDGQPVAGIDLPSPSEGWSGVPLGGQHIVKVDALGKATHLLYDAAGRLTDVWLPAVDDATTAAPNLVRPRWHYTYDASGNQLTQTAPNAYQNPALPPDPSYTTTYGYDAQGRRTSRTLPVASGATVSESWTYDHYGRTRTHTDFNGQTTAYVYDDAQGGRLRSEYRFSIGTAPAFGVDGSLQNPDAAAERTEYAYDSLSRRESAADFRNVTPGTSTWQPDTSTHYTFDPITGQTDSVRTTIGAVDLGTVHYTYDPATGRKVRTWTDANDTTYDYDVHGRLWHVTVMRLNNQNITTSPQVTTYTYDPAGNLKTVTQPNGLITTYAYDVFNRLTDEVVTRDNPTTTEVETTPLMDFHYTLREDGLRDEATETRYTTEGSAVFSKTSIDYTYDANGRLTDEALTVLGGGSNAPEPYHNHYTFDLAGNRYQKIIDAGYDGTTDETVTYTYNGRDQLIGEDSDTVDAHDITYRYDRNGSQTEKVAGTSGSTTTTRYLWDLRARMVAVDGNGDDLMIDADGVTSGVVDDSSDTTVAYDTDGVRLAETTVGNLTKYFVNDPSNPTGYAKAIEEKTGTSIAAAAISRSYVLGQRVEGLSDAIHGTLYVLADGHGSTRALLNLAGSVLQQYDYDVFGNVLTTSGDLSWTPWLFGGDGAYDPATGWTYHLARWRSDFRFVSYDSFEADPASPASLHKYVYANGNPVGRTDPTGFYTDADGYAVEDAVELIYSEDYPGQYVGQVTFGQPTGLGANPLLKPDIFDRGAGRKWWMEIKPNSVNGRREANTQHAAYTANFKPLGYQPNTTWVPFPQPLITPRGRFWVWNESGILFYTDKYNEVTEHTMYPIVVSIGVGSAVGSAAISSFAQPNFVRSQFTSVSRTAARRAAAAAAYNTKAGETETSTSTLLGIFGL